MEFKKTADQIRAIDMLGSHAKHVLLCGGSRSGKTFIFCYALVMRALKAAKSRHIILKKTFNSIKTSIGLDTMPKVLELCFPNVKTKLDRTDWYWTFENGSEIWMAGLDDKERVDKILGKEYATMHFNEISEISYEAVTTAMSRLAQNCPGITNKVYYDCNPTSKSHWGYKLFIEKKDPTENILLKFPHLYDSMVMNPASNAENLPDDYISITLESLPERARQRFLEGKWLDDMEGALWNYSMIQDSRRSDYPALKRVVVGVDPAVTAHEGSDLTGIVVVGQGIDDEFYVLEDYSILGTPLEWASQVNLAFMEWEADRVIGEVNNGGDLIEANLRTVNPNLPYKAVRSTKGKILRAEPIAALYEKCKVHHIDIFTELEEQMTCYNPLTATKSPDRLDAMVFGLTELTGGQTNWMFGM